jgi:hypothetical protein
VKPESSKAVISAGRIDRNDAQKYELQWSSANELHAECVIVENLQPAPARISKISANGANFFVGFLLLALTVSTAAFPLTATAADDIRVAGSGVSPQLFFSCCNRGPDEARSLLADPHVISSLRNLHAGVAVDTDDLSPSRAQIVQRLNDAGIPVVAGLVLPSDQGYYMNSGNAPQAAARFAAFQHWTAHYGLRWSAVALDIEPDIRLFDGLQHHRLRLASLLLIHYFKFAQVRQAREAYSNLIHSIQSQGYKVLTYQLPLVVVDREAHSTLLERLLGIVDVRGDNEVIMIFSGLNQAIGSAMIWTLGPDSQNIAVLGIDAPGHPLNWNDFSRDLIVASHFSHVIGVYNLEGAVRLGFLSRLETMDWKQSATISAQSIVRAQRLRWIARILLWLVEFWPLFGLAILLTCARVVTRFWMRRCNRESALGFDPPAVQP